jgi:protocatechuate 3,4-dioxygenase beta subunit
MKPSLDPRQAMSRRDFLGQAGRAGLGAVGLLAAHQWLLGCAAAPGAVGATEATGAAGALQGTAAWATGGTTALALASYPDPFLTGAAGEACTLAPALTLGPCYAETLVRKDISEGYPGLPVRLSFQVVYADTCEPVPDATVDIWHTNAAGIYSAFAKGSMCNPTDEEAAAAKFFRGVQPTDANGRADFDTVFPGWYQGRTVHIHFTVRVAGKDYVTSQLFFDDALTDAIMAAHPDYSGRPARGTRNTNDGIARQGGGATMLATARRDDGVLHAWKTLAIKRG